MTRSNGPKFMNKGDSGLHGAKYWRDKAEEARAMAGEMRDPVAKALMTDIARKYDLMAERAAMREAREK